MTESSVEEELEIVGWTPATVSPVLVAELPGQAVLLGLVSVVASGVHCELPETAIALLERPDEVTAQDLKLSSLRQRGKPTRKSCRVGFIEVLVDMLLLCEERPPSEQDARFTPVYSDLLPQGESLASAEDLPGGTVTPMEFPGLRQQQQRHPTPSAPAADVFPSIDSGLVSLVSTVGKLAKPAGGTGGRTWSSRHSAWRVGRSARHHSCRAVSLARRFPGPPCAIPEAAHSSSAGNADPSMPGAERGVGPGPESNVGASLGEALAALLQRAIRQPDSGCEVSAAAASSVEELEKIGLSGDGSRLGAGQLERLKLTRESNPSLVIRAHERETQRDLGVLLGEPWSYHRHARDKVLPAASGHPVLRTTIVILSRALDLLRGATPAQAQAFLSQAKRPRPRRATRTSSGRDDGRSWGSTTRMVRSARATRRRNTQLWRPSIATWSSWTSTCRGRSRAEAAPRKAQALQMPLEETQEPNAMPTCGPSWTRRRRTWPPFARREQARRLSLGKLHQCPPTIFSLAGGPFCTSNFSGVAEPRAPVFAREAAIGADRWLFDWARLSWSLCTGSEQAVRPFFCDGLPASWRHSDHAWKAVWKQRGQRAAWIPPRWAPRFLETL